MGQAKERLPWDKGGEGQELISAGLTSVRTVVCREKLSPCGGVCGWGSMAHFPAFIPGVVAYGVNIKDGCVCEVSAHSGPACSFPSGLHIAQN